MGYQNREFLTVGSKIIIDDSHESYKCQGIKYKDIGSLVQYDYSEDKDNKYRSMIINSIGDECSEFEQGSDYYRVRLRGDVIYSGFNSPILIAEIDHEAMKIIQDLVKDKIKIVKLGGEI